MLAGCKASYARNVAEDRWWGQQENSVLPGGCDGKGFARGRLPLGMQVVRRKSRPVFAQRRGCCGGGLRGALVREGREGGNLTSRSLKLHFRLGFFLLQPLAGNICGWSKAGRKSSRRRCLSRRREQDIIRGATRFCIYLQRSSAAIRTAANAATTQGRTEATGHRRGNSRLGTQTMDKIKALQESYISCSAQCRSLPKFQTSSMLLLSHLVQLQEARDF